MGAPTTSPIPPGMPGAVGSLDPGAWTEPPMGMERFAPRGGLIRWRGFWRIVIGSPAWGFLYGRPTSPGWDAPGLEWNTTPGSITPPAATEAESSSVPTLDLGFTDDDTMGTQTDSTFSVTPGSVESSAATGDLRTQGASVTLATEGTSTTATVTAPSQWAWIPWVLLALVFWLAAKRRGE